MAVAPGMIRVAGLCKSYGGHPALQEVSFTVPRGEILAYLGPNGAGKTTTIRILAGLLPRDAGEVEICGLDVAVAPVAVKRLMGVVPEESNLYPELSCQRNLEYLGELYDLSRAVRRARAAALMAAFGLGERAATPFGALSRGLRRRLTIAAALIHDPAVLFLDEPTTGLDVLSARALRETIRDINRQGKTVFLTTHNLLEAEELCHRVVILIKGRVVAQGRLDEVLARVRRLNIMVVAFTGEVGAVELRRACPAVTAAVPENGAWRLEVADVHRALRELVAFGESLGVKVTQIHSAGPNLEEAFVEIWQESLNAPAKF